MIAVFLGFSLPIPACATTLPTLAFAQDKLVIKTAKTNISFHIEIARTPEQQAYGLMNRDSIPANHGMLFIFEKDIAARMWMKDTKMPLDMLFIDRKGRIIYIAERTTPDSTAVITAGKPTYAVLELAGGTANKRHIKVGDRVLHHVFAP